MKILYIITRAEHGGAQVHLKDLFSALRNDFNINLVVGEAGFLTEKAQRINVRFHLISDIVRPLNPSRDFRAIIELVRYIRKEKPDIIHAHSSKAGFLGRIAAFLTNTPSIFTAHGWAFTDGVSKKQLLISIPTERLMSLFSSRIITVSEQDRRLALRYKVSTRERLITIHNGISDVPERAFPGEGDELCIAMVARFSLQKNQHDLIRACVDFEKCKLIFVGDGELLTSAQALASELGVLNRVEFLGTRDDVPEILARAHIFALITNYEGFPLSILEAMRAGLPVIASDVGGVNEAVVEGETGFLVPRGDVITLRDRLERLIRDPDLRSRMGQAGRVRFENNFTLDQMVQKTLEVYRQVLKEKSR